MTDHRWGYFDSTVLSRGAWMRQRLILLPPGTDASERRALTVFRLWPVVGALLASGAMIAFGELLRISPPLAFVMAFGAYGAILYATLMRTRELRLRSLRLVTVTMLLGGEAVSFGNVATMASTMTELSALDEGTLTAAEYEFECAALFWSLDARRSELDRELCDGIAASEEGRLLR